MNFRFVPTAALAALLSACGGGGGDDGAAPTSTAASPDIVVAAEGPATPFVAGGRAAYTFTATNVGPDAAADVALAFTVGAHQTLGTIRCTAADGAACPPSLSSAMMLPTLPKGGRLTFAVETVVSVDAFGTLGAMLTATTAGDVLASNDAATATAAATPPNSVTLRSDAGDHIGQGRTSAYSRTNAALEVNAIGNRLVLSVAGDEAWTGVFSLPGAGNSLQSGTYNGATRATFVSPGAAGMEWTGEGRGCNTLTGSFTLSNVTYVAGTLRSIDIAFEQHCEGGLAALQGQVHWTAYDTTSPPGPVTPVPAGLWQPAAGATPAAGNYVYLVSDSGDHIGGGATILETQATTMFSVAGNGRTVTVDAGGWYASFAAMDALPLLQPGYYGGMKRHSFHNGIRGGMDWLGNGRSCNTVSGWFVVDSVSYVGTQLSAIELRFEQHCDGATAALRGKIRWAPGDITAPPGPVNPPPAALWQPAAGTTPASGNFIYLVSDAGDPIGGGLTHTYTPNTPFARVTFNGEVLGVSADGWWASFVTMNTGNRPRHFEPGHYGDLARWPLHNRAKGGLVWAHEDRACNALSGWFAVDSVAYDGDALKAIDLRFEQHCEGMTPALRGRIRWTF